MATRDAAAVVGMGAELGTLERGKRADLQLVAMAHPRGMTLERVRSDLVWATRPEHVHTVIVNGEIVVADRQLTRVDEAAIRARATEGQPEIDEARLVEGLTRLFPEPPGRTAGQQDGQRLAAN